MFNVPLLMFILSSYLWANCRWFFLLAATHIVSKKRRKKNILFIDVGDRRSDNDILLRQKWYITFGLCDEAFKSRWKLLLLILLSFWSTHKRKWVKYRCIFSHLCEKLQCPEEAHCLNGRSMKYRCILWVEYDWARNGFFIRFSTS